MLKYYLDKTGKVIKSILFPSSEFVDTEPREGSLNPVTSGGVAGGMAQQSSNIAPNYTKTTYEANSYVMHDGTLYTNPNAIGTAEDWNPAHWTQTTVAEMVSGAGGGGSAGYIQRNVTVGVKDGWHPVVDVPNRSVTVASTSIGSDSTPWDIIIDNDCTDAIIILKFTTDSMQPTDIAITRVNGNPLTLYGTEGQLVTGDIIGESCGFEFEPRFNGIDGGCPCSEVLIHICGDTALLSFTVV